MHFDLLFAHLEQYVALTPAEKTMVRSRFTYQKVRKRQYLLQQDEICRADYFIVEGILRQYEVDSDGRENIVQFAMPNWWITDWYSMQSGIPSIYNIDALENAAVLKIGQHDLEELFVDVPAFNVYFRIICNGPTAICKEEFYICKNQRMFVIANSVTSMPALNNNFHSSTLHPTWASRGNR